IISGTTNFNGTKTVATITSATVFTYSAATVASESTGKVNGDIGHRGGGIQLRCPKVFVDGGLITDCTYGIRAGMGAVDAVVEGTTIIGTRLNGYNDTTTSPAFYMDNVGLNGAIPNSRSRLIIKGVTALDLYSGFMRFSSNNRYNFPIYVENCLIELGAGGTGGASLQSVFRAAVNTAGQEVSNVYMKNCRIRKHPNATAANIFYGTGANSFLSPNTVEGCDIDSGITLFAGGMTTSPLTFGL